MKKLYIFGATPYANLVAKYFSYQEHYQVCGHLVDKQYIKHHQSKEHPIYMAEDYLSLKDIAVFSAIGYNNMRDRKRIFDRINISQHIMPNHICEGSYVDPTVKMGINNIIMPGAVIEPYTTIGNNNIIWSNATICHDSIIGNHNFFAANTTIGGHCTIGDLCFTGFSSTVLQNLTIADESLIAAMSLINKDTESATEYHGISAKPKRRHPDHGIRVQ